MKKMLFCSILLINIYLSFSQSGVGEPVRIPYDKSMDKYIEGVFGYNPNLSMEGNEKFYNDNGYSISYKIKDSTIYLISTLVLILLFIIGFIINNRMKYSEKFTTIN